MATYVIQTLWNQDIKKLDTFLIDKIEKVCNDFDSLSFLGLYEPIIENWEWTYFIRCKGLVEWGQYLDRLMKNIPVVASRENRVFAKYYKSETDISKAPEYLEIELMLWDKPYQGLYEYYQYVADVFSEFDDAWFLGGYGPANEPYTVASFLGYDRMEMIDIVDDRLYSEIKRPEQMNLSIERLYRKYSL